MNKDAKGRRTLLQQGLALLGGGVAVAAGARWSRGGKTEAAPPDAKEPLKVYARIRPIAPTNPAQSLSDARMVATGDLLDAPDGKRVGDFSANCFYLGTPMGTQVKSIIGGTARFAGARGTYVQRPIDAPGAHDVVEFTVSIAD
jgi:hypothetical protein